MSKIEVIGPRELLVQVLATIQHSQTVHVDRDICERMPEGAESRLMPLAPDAATIAERVFDEDVARRIERLLDLLPAAAGAPTVLDPARAVGDVAALLNERIALCESKTHHRDALRAEVRQLERALDFLTTVDTLVPDRARAAGLDVIAVQLKDASAVERFTEASGHLPARAMVRTARTDDGSYIGLLTTEKETAEQLRQVLRDDQIPEASLPSYLEGLPLAGKIAAVRARRDAIDGELRGIDAELQGLAAKWRRLHRDVLDWLRARLDLLRTSALAYRTDDCFVLFGWAPTGALPALRASLAATYGGTVVVDEKAILEQDLDSVPVTLLNRPYFKPFELLVSLLPLPRYESIDPTPFIGLFFPVLFGMILGDVGYGVLLLVAAVVMAGMPLKPETPTSGRRAAMRQVGRIMGPCAAYAIVFGVVYGECFGAAGAQALGQPAPWLDRRESFLPTLLFAIGVGSVHVVIGLALGVVAALRGHHRKEAAFRLACAVVILALAGLGASYVMPVGALMRQPLLVTVLVAGPILLLAGGLLAPFELLRYLGNIISYARIMAVGLASVLLAHVANRLAGAAGSLWVGITVAALLHAFNLVLGVFAPTIHALRLHYVEFFTKFFEPGGKPYHPLKDTP